MTLAEFLLARIAEDEAEATLVASAPPKWSMTVYPHDGEEIPVDVKALQPARVLADCVAKRRIVEAYRDERTRAEIYQRNPGDETPEDRDRRIRSWARQRGLEIAVQSLALPYAGHADYQPEWRP